ncbi:ATP-dependent DNA helicase [Trichonephila inaurata madagascariensis]|uniref:ATP-dependent DNA helicase n=1 Tax=Trichonephila inaurata madagascariensis TaxID=2747483 RepID=A0A8X6IRX1_9ARAC|nr:ATP-dependent DNA helicase [Trichonephila inaurata madagascariensis]
MSVPRTPYHALSATNRLLKDLMGLNVPFRGKVMVLEMTGDRFYLLQYMRIEQQLLRRLKNSRLWSPLKQFSLIKNMRTYPNEQYFASWLLHLGKGTSKNDCQ